MTHRVVLVSDMHYTVDESEAELKLRYPESKASAAAGDAFGRTQREKIECVYADIAAVHEKTPLDACFVLGDLSIDDWDYRQLPQNFVRRFREDCMDRWAFPAYAIPGNHDSYSNKLWQEATGTERQYAVTVGGAMFVMLDTFADFPAAGASGAGYTGADLDFVRACAERAGTMPVFLCAHYIRADEEAFFRLMAECPNVVCCFMGHTHRHTVCRPQAAGGKVLCDIGGYGYEGKCIGGRWFFSIFSPEWAWGYEVLEWDDSTRTAEAYHVCPPRVYKGCNGVFDCAGEIGDRFTARF